VIWSGWRPSSSAFVQIRAEECRRAAVHWHAVAACYAHDLACDRAVTKEQVVLKRTKGAESLVGTLECCSLATYCNWQSSEEPSCYLHRFEDGVEKGRSHKGAEPALCRNLVGGELRKGAGIDSAQTRTTLIVSTFQFFRCSFRSNIHSTAFLSLCATPRVSRDSHLRTQDF
jgi:hypothetical protein